MKVKVEGLKACNDALMRMKQSTGRGVVRRILKAAAEPMAEHAEALAPKDTGALRESIKVGSTLSKRQRALHRKASALEVFMGPGTNPQAIAQEFGAYDDAPQPFMRPAWDAGHKQALRSVADDLAGEIEKTAKRAEKRAAAKAKRAARGR